MDIRGRSNRWQTAGPSLEMTNQYSVF